MKKNLLIVFCIWIGALWGQPPAYTFQNNVSPEDVTIYRDSWGVPHIYGKTDAAAAYGLAWAHAEDDFPTIQKTLAMSKHLLGTITGKEGAKVDYVHQLLRLDPLVEQAFDTLFSPEFLAVIEGYCQGINAYAAKHPNQVLNKRIFPVNPKDLVKGYALSIALMSGLDRNIKAILNGSILDPEPISASNSFAFSRKIMVEGLTTLIINAHQPLEGQVAFYEAHLMSEQGLNILGGTFPGAVSILHGVTPTYGWAHTSNFFDKMDVYQLTMKSPKSDEYLLNGQWKKLEKHKAKLRVKLGFLRITLKKPIYWSAFGATLKTKHGVFSIRTAANQEFRAAEQWFRMGKCKNFQAFYETLRMQALPVQNITYADKEDNILFIANGLIPHRQDTSINWKCCIKGEKEEFCWDGFYPIEAHPQVLNPSCGYVFNVNHTPFQCTCPAENPNPNNYPCKIAGFEMEDNNRSLRFRELYKDGDTLSINRLKAIKYDLYFPKESVFLKLVHRMQNLSKEQYPDVQDIMQIFKQWNHSMDTTNIQATILYLAFAPLFKRWNYSTVAFRKPVEVSDSLLAEGLRFAKQYLLKHFKSLEVPFGKILRHRRGNKDYAIGGYPDVMASMMGLPDKDGLFKAFRGEDLIIFAYFNEHGLQNLETIKAYGNSSNPNSPHYNDQMELYLKNQTKNQFISLQEVQQNAVRSYKPQ